MSTDVNESWSPGQEGLEQEEHEPAAENKNEHKPTFGERVKSWFYVKSDENSLYVLPRADGVPSSQWKPEDIGFFLPSHYFEREDGQTPRSMAGSTAHWERTTADAGVAVDRVIEGGRLDDLIGGAEVREERRLAAAALFLEDIFAPEEDPSGSANESTTGQSD